MIEQGKQIAAHVLEASAGDIEFKAGRFVIAGTDRSIGIMELAQKLRRPEAARRRADNRSTCAMSATACRPPSPTAATSPRSRSIRDTGRPRVVKYTAVNDFGTVINPMIVEGQIHGGVVQGIGQALMEHAVYDADGQLLTGSFMDYAMPRAARCADLRRSRAIRCRPRPIRSASRAAARPAAPARCPR